ncbi:hypothetical protein BS50DRAFT_76413 [Corynespora cassiicola Philippines]|uniref:Uncharacterized protein n=1 Tax=Corynespora cassiicola Philippines TaxID=1448308 RepID=A0A2T2NGF8_CORCC|nr:hypothetical protein BS50DRAFT_76413 [Corynespora cassiicola Philippines]
MGTPSSKFRGSIELLIYLMLATLTPLRIVLMRLFQPQHEEFCSDYRNQIITRLKLIGIHRKLPGFFFSTANDGWEVLLGGIRCNDDSGATAIASPDH